MYTRCPKCKMVHPLTAELLAYARGSVRCGQCHTSFDAMSSLFDQWPSGQGHRPASEPNARPPVLGRSAERPDVEAPRDPEPEEPPGKTTPGRLGWVLLTIMLVPLTVANTAWTFRDPLLQNPAISALLEKNGWLQYERHSLLKNPQRIQLVSRDMHTHPTRSGILVLSLTLVNLAERSQVFPLLEVTLLDAANQPVARRRFQPQDYLRSGADIRMGLAADVLLPVLLELGDPGEQATGFEIRFL